MNKIIDLPTAIEILKKGGVGIFPTDTAFGIGCRIDNPQAVEKIYNIRRRPSEKALLALVSSVEMASEYVEINESVKSLLEKFWPGGLTVILKCKTDKVPENVRAGGSTLAVRMPDHVEIRKVVEMVGVPIVAPSANFSGEATPLSLEEVDMDLIEAVDFVLDGVCTMKGVSTIVDLTKSAPQIVRQGVVEFA